MSQKHLGEKAGVNESWLSRIENGRDTNPAWATVRSLAAALDVSIVSFVTRVVDYEEGRLEPPGRSRVRGRRRGQVTR